MNRVGHGGAHGPIEKARDFKGTMRKLLKYIGAYKAAIIVVMILAVASTAFAIVGPKILGETTTLLFNGLLGEVSGSGGVDLALIGSMLVLLLCIYGVSALCNYLQGYIMAGVTMKITYALREDISEKINRLPLGYFDKVSHGEVLSRITNDVDTVSQTLNQSVSQIITSVVMVVGVLAMMLSISVWMTLIALVIVPVALVAVLMIIKRSQKYFASQQMYLGEVNSHVEEMYAGHNVVASFNAEKATTEEFDGKNEKLYAAGWKANFMSGIMMPITSFVGNVGYVAVAAFGGAMAASGTLAVGDILSFVQYIRNFTQPMTQLANISNVLQQTAAASERVFDFLSEKEEVPESAKNADAAGLRGNVEFSHVRFGYTSDKIIINDFSARFAEGQKVAIVGPTGAGKTTLVKLLMRFYDVTGGQILVDGHDIRDLKRDELRSMFGMVLQDTWLYNDTIMENIRYGRRDATDEEVVAAAKAAHAHHFIRALPQGYDMVVNEEASNISQGQKQLLTIARAILKNPKMLILDEATSSVDTRTEMLIQKGMDAAMKGKLSFIIAHRLSTIRDADTILVMQGGDIVEQGTHQELLSRGGLYAELYMSQFAKAV